MKNTIYLFLILMVTELVAQNPQEKILPFEDYYKIILLNHPIVKQADLLQESAKREIRVARGEFDPKYDFDYTKKEFKGSNYYDYIDNGLKIPLWFGPDIKAGFEKNSGIFLNPTNYTPKEGLWYVGLDVPIGKGMIMDERRAVVRQAQLLSKAADAEKIKIINKILLSAAKDYWEWYFYYNKYKQIQEAYTLAEIRFNSVKARIELGDGASIDSIEAKVTLQDREVEMIYALNDFQNSTIKLSNYLWTEDNTPIEIEAFLIPENTISAFNINDSTLIKMLEYGANSHPELIKMNYKISQLNLDQKLKMNNLLPSLNAGVRYLSTPKNNVFNDLNYNYINSNYKIMVSLTQPLFIRKERGKYQLSRIKVNQAQYEQQILTREIKTTINSSFNDIKTILELIKYQQNIIASQTILLNGEKEKFSNGESNLFLVNARENKLVEGKIKLFDLKAKLEKAKASLYWSTGNMNFEN